MCGRQSIKLNPDPLALLAQPMPRVVPTLRDFAESLSIKFEADGTELALLAMNPALSAEARDAILSGAAAASTLGRVYAAAVSGNKEAGKAALWQTLADAIEAGVI